MSKRVDDTFARLQAEGKKAFVAYVTAGDPDADRSLEIINPLSPLSGPINGTLKLLTSKANS